MNIIEKPWGQEEVIELNDRYMVKRLTMVKGKRCSLQYHHFKTETIYVLAGALKITLGWEVLGGSSELRDQIYYTGDCVTIPPGQVHRMEAIQDCLYLEASTPEINDVVRLVDDYGRSS